MAPNYADSTATDYYSQHESTISDILLELVHSVSHDIKELQQMEREPDPDCEFPHWRLHSKQGRPGSLSRLHCKQHHLRTAMSQGQKHRQKRKMHVQNLKRRAK